MKMAEDGKITEHINEFMDVVESQTEVEIILADEILVILLLSNSPKSFENFVVAIETRDNLPLFSSLKIKLLEEVARQREIENMAYSNSVGETFMQYYKKNNNYRYEKGKTKHSDKRIKFFELLVGSQYSQ